MKTPFVKNLTGSIFNDLTVIKFVRKEVGRSLWLCKCVCGNKIKVRRHNLTMGVTKSCGCIRQINGVLNNVFERYKRQAKTRNLKFDLTKEQVRHLIFNKCSYCGSIPENKNTRSLIMYNGIDRLNNKKGYTKFNCVTACKYCNRSKGIRTLTEFHNWIINVYEKSICDKY